METELSQATQTVDDGTRIRAAFRHGLNSQEIAEAIAAETGRQITEAEVSAVLARPAETPRQQIRALIDEVIKRHAKRVRPGFAVTYADVMSTRRDRHIVVVRHACIRRVHEARPDLSTPALGRIFGRDHTSVLYALGGRRSRLPHDLRQASRTAAE